VGSKQNQFSSQLLSHIRTIFLATAFKGGTEINLEFDVIGRGMFLNYTQTNKTTNPL
jgi:riboflavin synthase alpha subunit